MRKRYLIGACVLATAVLVPSTAFGAASAIQTIEAELGGKTKTKFDKKKFKKTSFDVETTTADAANPSGMPPKAGRALITFDKKDVKFNPKAVPGCANTQIAGTTTAAALAACGPAKVGAGDAIAALPFGVGGARTDFPVVVTAFNNGDANGILLHSRVDSLGTTTTLVGTLQGTKLDVAIPPLGGGVGAIAQFHTNVKAKDYVSGRCKAKTIKTKGTFFFTDGTPDATATDTQKCKQKKKKKGGK
jgi:hypothetical protein